MIDFEALNETLIPKMRGGQGAVKAKIFDDGSMKFMRLMLEQGVSIGEHRHSDNFEAVFVLSGEAVCSLNGKEETVPAGCAHYCPRGSTHSIYNKGETPLVLLAVIPAKTV